jgi:exodeoxyribonuclease VII large subunit
VSVTDDDSEKSHGFVPFDSAQAQALRLAVRVAGVPLRVSQLTAITRELLERGLPMLWVGGEVSNFTRAASGHCYFSLKDEQAQVRCVMFRHRLAALDWVPANGEHVEVRAAPGLYEPRGEFQLNVDFMRRAGLGVLFERFSRLKAKLEAEGLFEPARKRPVPHFAQRVGVVTSTAGAALRDVLSTLRRRMPGIGVVIYPTPVQGEGAAQQIAAAVAAASARAECDVLVVCRGGGSIEDLWAFNEEVVARAIADCALPVVSGVGHETDFTIADFVADVRAPTPTAAAELVSPDRAQLARRVGVTAATLRRAVWRVLERRMQQADYLSRRLLHPGERIAMQQRHLALLAPRLMAAWGRADDARAWGLLRQQHRLRAAAPRVAESRAAHVRLAQALSRAAALRLAGHAQVLERLRSHLIHLDPRAVLARGYAIVRTQDAGVVTSSAQLAVGTEVEITLGQGAADARIVQVKP